MWRQQRRRPELSERQSEPERSQGPAQQQLEPGAPIQGEFEVPAALSLPCTLHAALQRLQGSALARQWFGDEFVGGYCATKSMELMSFLDEITPWERRVLANQV